MPRLKLSKITENIADIYRQKVPTTVIEATKNRITNDSLKLITNISEDMRTHIGELLRKGEEEGKSISATASTLLKTGLDEGVFKSARRRAYLIARTELHRSRQMAAVDLYKAAKIEMVKWVVVGDSRLCSTCQAKAKTYHIKDIEDNLPPEHPRCRCRVLPSDFQMSIKVKKNKKDKVVETQILPTPKDYLYVVKLGKALEKARPHKYIRREGVSGKYEYFYHEAKKQEGVKVGGFEFVQPERAIKWGSQTILVDVSKFEKVWSKDTDMYVSEGGKGAAISNRYSKFKEFLKTGQTIEMPEVSGVPRPWDKTDHVGFTNGRHRFAVLRDMGFKVIPVSVDKESVPYFKKYLEYNEPKTGIKTVGIGIAEQFKKAGFIDLRGQKVSSVKDVAELAQIYRNPQYETFRYIYVKNGVVVGHEGRSSRIPGLSGAFVREDRAREIFEIKRRIARLGADSVWLVHNHPSGNPTPSRDDALLTKLLMGQIPEVKGHIVVDSQTFGLIERDESARLAVVPSVRMLPLVPHSPSRPILNHPLLGQIVKDKKDVANVANILKVPKTFATIIYRGGNQVKAIQEIPVKMLSHYEATLDYLRGRSREFGGHDIVVAIEGETRTPEVDSTLEQLVTLGQVLDAVSYGKGELVSLREGVSSIKEWAAEGRGEWMGRPIHTYVAKALEKGDFASTQVNLPKPIASKMVDLVKLIDPKDLHPTEKQGDEVHITVRYGLLPEVPPEDVKEVLQNSGKVIVTILGVDAFQPEGKDYDVLVLRVDSPDLARLNAKLKQLPHEDTFPFYQPHSTIAYLKRGLGKKYANLVTGLEGELIEFDAVKFSDKDYNKLNIALEKAKRVYVPAGVGHKSYTRLDPREKKEGKVGQLESKLKQLAERHVTALPTYIASIEQMEHDPDVERILNEGKLYSSINTKKELMVDGLCHWNVASLFKKGQVDAIVIGYALSITGQNQWHQHTWGLKDGKVVETTRENVGNRAYYGVELRGKEAEDFASWCEKNKSGEGKVRRDYNWHSEGLEKAKSYARFRYGKYEHVKGWQGKPRLHDLSPQDRINRYLLDPTRPEIEKALNLVKDISKAGGRALLVGGCVRDALLGRHSKDIDIEVYGVKPEELASLLHQHGKVDQVGKSFGVFKVSSPELDEAIDVSIPRRESKTGKGHKGFMIEADPIMTEKEAASRRDLTINSLAYDPIKKEIVDPFNGVQDLKDHVLRATDPNTFGDDSLRVLRVMRFAAQLGFTPEVKLAWICNQIDLTDLPKERIFGELSGMLLKAKHPSIGLMLMPILGIGKILPELVDLKGVEQEPDYHPEGDAWTHTLMVVDEASKMRDRLSDPKERLIFMLGALCHDLGKPQTTEVRDGKIISHSHDSVGADVTTKFLDRLTEEQYIVNKVVAMVQHHMKPTSFLHDKVPDSAIRRLAKKVDIPMLIMISAADKAGRGLKADLTAERWMMRRFKALGLEHPEALDPKVRGRDLIPLGIEPGPEMGRMLDKIYNAQLEGLFQTTEEGLEYAKKQGWIFNSLTKSIKLTVDAGKVRSLIRRLRKSRERVIPYNEGGNIVWVKPTDKGTILQRPAVKGDKVLMKGGWTATVVAVGKDGCTIRNEIGKKYQIFNKDIHVLARKGFN